MRSLDPDLDLRGVRDLNNKLTINFFQAEVGKYHLEMLLAFLPPLLLLLLLLLLRRGGDLLQLCTSKWDQENHCPVQSALGFK